VLAIKAQKKHRNFSLEVDVRIEPGFTALFGASGAGKTTLLNLIAGTSRPDSGEIMLDDRTLFSSNRGIDLLPRRRRIGYIFQESRLFPHLSVQKNLEFGWKNLPPSQRKFDFDEIVQVTGLSKLLDRRPDDLSGGERQRVALARALLASPDYLLMDEPLAALDLPVRLAFLNFLKSIHEKYHLPILYVSHDLAQVLTFAEQVILLQEGNIIGYGPPYSLLKKMTAAPLISGEDIPNIFEMQVLKHDPLRGVTEAEVENIVFLLPRLNVETGQTLLLNIPASEIILATEEPNYLSASNIFLGNIVALHYLGERVLVEIDAGEPFMVEIVPATVERLNLEKGKEVYLIIKASSFRRLG